jgi:outer membrane protein assembly factor BamA
MTLRGSRLVRRALLTLASIVSLVILLVLVVHLGFVRARVLDWLEARVERDLGIAVEADGLGYNLFSPSAELRNVRLSVAGERPFLRADAARIAVARSVFRGVLEPQRLELSHATVTIVRHRDGSTNLPSSKTDSSSKPAPLHLGIVALEALKIDVEDEAARHRLAAGPIDLTLDTRAGTSSTGEFGPSPIAVRIGSTDPQVQARELSGTMAGRLGFDGARVTAREVSIDTPEGHVKLDGWIDAIAETIRTEARARLETDLARAARLAGPAASLAGSATADIAVAGSLEDLTVRATIVGRNVRYQSMPGMDLTANAIYSGGRIEVERIALTSELGEINATGSVDLGATAGSSRGNRLSAQIAGADLDRILAAAGLKLPVQIGSTAAGQVDVALDATTPLNADAWRQLTVDGSIDLAPSGKGLSQGGTLDLAMNGGLWKVAHSLRAPAGGVALDGTVSGDVRQADTTVSTLSGATHLQVQQVQGLQPLLKQAGVSLPAPVDQIDGRLDARIVPRGNFAAPAIQATLSGRGIRVPDITDAGELESTLTIDQKAVTATMVDVRLGQAHLTGSGMYMWSGQINTAFEGDVSDLGALAEAFDLSDLSLAGSTALKGSLAGSARAPHGNAQLTARDLSAYGVSIGSVAARLALADDRLDVDADAPNLNVDLKGGLQTRAPFNFQAEIGLDRSSVASLVPPQQTVPVDGTITATLRARGSAQQLSGIAGDIDLRALDLKVSGVPIALSAPARVSFEPDLVTATSLALRVGAETELQLQGSLGASARNGVDVRVTGTVDDLLDIAASLMPELPVESENSRVSLELHVGGTLAAPVPTGTMTLQAESFRYSDIPPLSDVVVNARIEATRIALQTLTAEWQGATLAGEGMLPLRMIAPAPRPNATGLAAFGSAWLNSLPPEPRSATLSARVTGLTSDALAPFVDQAQLEKISGNLELSASAEADAFSLEALQASVVVDRASLNLAGVPVTQAVPTRVRLERGRATLEGLRLNAQGNELTASGSLDLIGVAPAIDLVVDGAVDLRMLGAFASGFASGGVAQTAFTVKGPLAAPEVVGSIDVTAGEVRLDTPPVSASDFNGSILVDAARRATITLGGFVNGGWTDINGSLVLENLASPLGRVNLTAYNVMLEYPDGFQTESNADLAFTLGPSTSTLSGRVDIMSGLYREPIVVSRKLLAGFGGTTGTTVGTDSSFLDSLRLNVTVATANEMRIDNNYGRLSVSANLSVTGSAAHPGALGRIEAEPDGEVYLAGNTYRIQTLVIDLTNPRTIAPEVTFLAETRIGSTPIEIALQCAAAGPCERDVRSLDGSKTNEEAEALLFGLTSNSNANEAGAQLARLLSGELLGIVSGTVGLDTLRLEQSTGQRSDLFDDPTLIAGDVDPASRLTIGKRLGDHVELAYSQDLADNGFVMSTTYFAPAGISIRALLLDNQDRSYEFRHQPRFGGAKRTARPAPPPAGVVKAVQFTGNPGFDENDLRGQLSLKEGDRFEFAKWQADRERLNRFYFQRNFYEARVRARRSLPSEESVTLEYNIERGKPARLEVTGFNLPEDITRRIVDRWTSAIFDGFLERDVALIVREYLYQQGHMQAVVRPAVAETDEGKTLKVEIEAGPVMNRRLQFEGNSSIPTPALLAVAENAGPLAAWIDSSPLALAITRRYQDQGFLSATVEIRAPEVQGDTSVVRVLVREGEAWQIGRVTLGGAEPVVNSASDLGLASGTSYDPAVIAERLANLEQRFRDRGFFDVRVVSETVLDQEERKADVHVLVQPGPRRTLASVAVEGVDADNTTVAQSLGVGIGEPISASALGAARRKLYETGQYRSVEVALEPVSGAAPLESSATGDVPAVVRVRVEERPRYSFRYGLSVNSDAIGPDERDTRLGFAADLENRNLFGRGMTVGLSARLRRDQEVGRVFLGATQFFGFPLRSNVFLSRSRQDIGSSETARTVSDVTDLSAEQVYRLRRLVDLHYGYGFGGNRTTFTDPVTNEKFDLTVRVARLTTSAVVDRRSDPFDPTKGWFTSASFELSRPGLGSELSFLRTFMQLYQFAPIRDGLVLASTVRVGLAPTFRGETLIPSERFFAGGATSVRGYIEDDLGPRSIFGDADGGSALFIANGELRFPVYRWIRGVGFVDLGDVYPTIGDLLTTGVQVGTGGGIRVNTPVGLLRLDLAFPMNPRPFDPQWRVHFGLGHAF